MSWSGVILVLVALYTAQVGWEHTMLLYACLLASMPA